MTDVDERIRNIVSVELQVSSESITSSTLLADLGMDSVSALNIMFAVEEAFGLPQFDVTQVVQIKAIGDLERIVEGLLTPRA